MKNTTKEIIHALSHGPVQKFIMEHETRDVRDLMLKNKVLLGIPTVQLIEQITTRRKAKIKLPLYYHTPGTIFPPPAYFEQSSSEATAVFKSEMIAAHAGGDKSIGADLTGGFGVDSYFLSRKFKKIHFVEPENGLLEIARYNHQLLGAGNIEYHPATAENFIGATEGRLDFVYADPSRRTGERKKVHALSDSQPDILQLRDAIFRKTELLVVKASPLLDIQAGLAQLRSVKKVYVVAVDNECRELLFFCAKDFTGIPVIEAVNISGGQPEQSFAFSFPEERDQTIGYSEPRIYLYEPHAAILKAGAFKSLARRYNIDKIHINTHLYTSDHLIEGFPGRRFLIEAVVKPDKAALRKFFPNQQANITTRNYPLAPEALKKKTGLKDGGERFLIGFTGPKKKYLVAARRV